MLLTPNWASAGALAGSALRNDSTSVLYAPAGTRKLSAGTGDDVLWYDPGYDRIDGGPGNDTLRVALPGTTLDLTGRNWLFSVENIDLTPAGGTSTVLLDWHEIMRLTSAPHALHILGMAGDSVYAGTGWSYGGVVDGSAASYAVYENAAATLLVDTDIRRSTIVDHAPDAQADKAITIAEDSAATPLAISAPVELDGDALVVTVTAVPNGAIGSVFLSTSDGAAVVSAGQSLTVAQLQTLSFAPVHDAYGDAGAFSYTVADHGTALGLSDAQSIALAVTSVNEAPVLTPAGLLDTTFGTRGVVLTPIGAHSDYAYAALALGNGGLLVAGSAYASGNVDFAFAKYRPDGALDTSFGQGGIVLNGFGTAPVTSSFTYSLIPHADDAFVAVGWARDFALARYTRDGALDTSFGGDGRVVTPIGVYSIPGEGIVQSDGRYVVAGTVLTIPGADYSTDFALARYHPDGGLDTSFGIGGIVTTDVTGYGDGAYAVAVQPDGKYIAGGYTYDGARAQFELARYNVDGGLDATFGAGGKVVTPFASMDAMAYDLALQADGRIVMAGWGYDGTQADFLLARYEPDGSLDASFGDGGRVVTDLGGNDEGFSVALQPDGKLVMAGYTYDGPYRDFSVVRYNGDGSLDTSFSGEGTAFVRVGAPFGSIPEASGFTDVALAADGGIMVVGTGYNGTNLDFAVARLTGGGLPDQTAGAGEPFRLTVPSNLFTDPDGDVLTYSGLLSDGSALPAWLTFDAASRTFSGTPHAADIGQLSVQVIATNGHGVSASDTFVVSVARANHAPALTAAGTLDATFGGDGIVTTPIGTNNDRIADLALQHDGRIVAAGASNYGYFDLGSVFSAVRYQADGSLDTSFSGDGRVITPIMSRYEGANAVALQPDGDVVLAGTTSYTGSYVAMTRYDAYGNLDTSFAGDGIYVGPIGAGTAVSTLADGKLLVGGDTGGAARDFMLMRLHPDGTVDSSFGQGGIAKTAITAGGDWATSMVVQPDGDIVLGGNSPAGIALVRYHADGSLDTSFGDEGIVTDSWGGSSGAIHGVARTPAGQLVAAGYTVTDGDYDFAVARYNADGSTDAAFGEGGVVRLSFAGSDLGYGVAVQANGRILVVGDTYSGTATDRDVAIARLNTDGTLDTSFGDQGKAIVVAGASSDSGTSVVVQPDGGIVVGGFSNNGHDADYLVLRLMGGALPDQVAYQSQAFDLTVPENLFTDPDGDPLTYSARLANGQALPDWLTFDPATREFSGTPASADLLDIRVTATDTGGLEASDVFRLAVGPGSDWVM